MRVFRDGRTGYAYGSDLSEEGLRDARARGRRVRGGDASPTSTRASPREPGAAPIAGLRRARASATGPWSGASSSRWRSSAPRASATRWSRNVEDTVYSDSRGARRARQLQRLLRLLRGDPVLRVRVRVRRRGRGPHDRHGVRASARGPDELDPEAVGHEAADRALALHGARQPAEPPLPGGARPVRRGELRLDHRRHAVGRRRPARPLAVRRHGGRADRRAGASGSSTTACDPEGLATAPFDGEGVAQQRTPLIEDGVLRTYLFDTYTADKAERESTGNGDARLLPDAARPCRLDQPARRPRRRERPTELLAAAGDGLYVMGVSRAALGRQPDLGQLLRGRHGTADPGRRAGRAGARDDDRLGPRVDAAGRSSGPRERPAGCPFGGSVQAPALLVAR